MEVSYFLDLTRKQEACLIGLAFNTSNSLGIVLD